jgi:murein DD-endopeptidase MepM/ murein hydrolase activator NlpD
MNKLNNASFEGGWWHPDGIPELQIPAEWGFWYADESIDNPIDPNPWARFVRPEVRVLPREHLPPHEQDLFILAGDYCLKPFKGNGSLLFTFYQVIHGFAPGRDYDFTIRFYPDVVAGYEEGQKIFADDPRAVRIRFAINDEPNDWQDANPPQDTPIDQRLQTVTYRFTAPSIQCKVEVRFMLPFPLSNNGLFCDKWELRQVDVPEPLPEPVGGSRLGTHSINAASPAGDTLDLLREWRDRGGQPAVIKAVSDLGWLAEAREICPDSVIVARIASQTEGCQDVEDPDTNLTEMAQDLMAFILDKLNHHPELHNVVDYWEVCNEPDPPGDFGYAQLSRLMIHCMNIADTHGVKLALFSLNAGTPEWSEMVEMCETDVFARAKAGGHALALHEGVFDDDPIDKWWGDQIPGSPIVPGAGALCFRYRYLYHLLQQRGEVVPLIISEFRTHGGNHDITTEEVVERFAWYDSKARQDDYVLGVTPFTLGAPTDSQWWPSHDYGIDYPELIDYAVSVGDIEPPPIDPPSSGRGQPREQYQRSYVLLPPYGDGGLASTLCERFFDDFRPTVGGSADDAGIGDLDDRAVIAVQSTNWTDGLQAFFEQHYPGVRYLPADGGNEYQLLGRVLASLLKARGLSLAYPTTHRPAHITSEFGVDRETYYHNGLDLRASHAVHGDHVLAAHDGKVIFVGRDLSEEWFGHQIKTLTTLPDGKNMQIRYAHLVDGGTYVQIGDFVSSGAVIGEPDNTGNSTGDHLHIDVKIGEHYADPEILIDWDDAPRTPVVLGMHDDAGGDWMRNQGIQGYLLIHRAVRDTVEPIDVTRFEQVGIKVIARWGYGYGGTGTVPPIAQTNQWVDAITHTINQSRGIYLHTLFNEWNNPVEWAGGYPNPDEVLTPARVLDLYNRVADWVTPGILLAPGAIDPFNVVAQEFGQPGDPKVWLDTMHNAVDRIDAILLHAKTQTNDPAECASNEKFSDAPLTGRYLHLRTYLDQLAWVKSSLQHLPVFITEVNPQRIDDTQLGWLDDNAAWIEAAVKEFDRYNATGAQPVTGICFYRYDPADDWGLMYRPVILDEIARQAGGGR